MKGSIFDIQRFAVHDGPGIRSTVFLKGCSARCAWCHNPESLSIKPELQFYEDRCLYCGKCVQLCPAGAHKTEKNEASASKHTINRNLCTACGICAAECFSNALIVSGRVEDVDEIIRQVLEDRHYYNESGGGVTLSGGEPVLQTEFCLALLKALKENKIHTTIQTAGFYPYEMLEKLLPYLDLVMYDVKAVTDGIYEKHIHGDKELALGNLSRLDSAGIPIIVRTPCISGINDSDDEITAIAELISSLKNLEHYKLIPYHGLARVKYDILGKDFKGFDAPSKERLGILEELASRYVKVFSDERGIL